MIQKRWERATRIRNFLRRYMPTNILLDLIRTRRGLKWGIPAMGLGVLYLLTGRLTFMLIEGGAPEWLYLLVLLLGWNGLKFIAIGPVSLASLTKARVQESLARRRTANEGTAALSGAGVAA